MVGKKMINQNENFKDNKIQDIKLKPLSPTLRQKKRFVKIRILRENSGKFDFKEVSENLIENLILYLGLIDFGKGGVWILRDKFNFEEQILVLKISTKLKDKLIGALALINRFGREKVKIEVLNVSGTLKGLNK